MRHNFKKILLLIFLISGIFCFSQNVKIKGKAHPSHKGKAISLLAYSDLVTYTRVREATDTIDKDGSFELQLQIDYTQPVQLQIDNLLGKLYIQPDYVYAVTFPGKDTTLDVRGETETNIDIGIISGDTTELNTLVIDFNKVYNMVFANASSQFINRTRVFQKLDTVKLICSWRYRKNKNNYFKTYVEYNIAELNSDASRSKTFLSSNFLLNKPVQSAQYEYMAFFNAFFKGYLEAYSSGKANENIHHLINTTGQYKDLRAFVKKDPLLANDTLCELVIIKSLWDFYYNPQYDREQVLAVIEQFFEATKIPENKKIAGNILQIAYKLSVGSKAPVFSASDRTGKAISLADFNKRYVYINFFSTKDIGSMKEMPKIAELVKKYADKMVFISICTDDSLKTYKNYLKTNPKYNWTILFNNSLPKGNTAYDLYNVKGLPAFFFINQFGNLAQSPAKSPTQGFEYKLKALFKPKKSDTKIGIR
jgi:thiol-disulfide isomerase/thioredoxin